MTNDHTPQVRKLLKRDSIFKYIERNLKLGFQLLSILVVEIFRSCIDLFKTVEPKSIEGQTALVTGGGNGLGKEICVELAKRGCHVAVVDIDLPGATKTSEMLKKQYGVKTNAYKVDVSKYAEIEQLKTQIESDIGCVDIIINNAGLTPTRTIEEYSPEYLQRLVDINFLSNVWTVKVFLPGMKTRKRGHIVQIASAAGISGVPISGVYSGTKFGVRGFMDSLAMDLVCEDLEDYIHTTTVFPYFIATNEELCKFLDKNDNLLFLPAFSASYCARVTVEKFLKNKQRVMIPKYFDWFLTSINMFPRKAQIGIQKILYAGAIRYIKKLSAKLAAQPSQPVQLDVNQNVTKNAVEQVVEKAEEGIKKLAEEAIDNVFGGVVENVMDTVVRNVHEN